MRQFKITANEKRRRDKRINFWITQREHDEIEERASRLGMNISDFLRMLALQTEVDLETNKIKFKSNKFFVEAESNEEDSTIQEYYSSLVKKAASIDNFVCNVIYLNYKINENN